MLDKKDVQWWVLEAQKHPESATDLIRILADRLAFLDKQNEELRGELITLRRKAHGPDDATDVGLLQERIQQLENALRQGRTGQRSLICAGDRIEVNGPLNEGPAREMPGDVSILVCDALAKLLIITDEAQAFSIALDDLPVPQDGPALLGNPNNVASILDQGTIERSRFLALLSQNGYDYSVLAGTVQQAAKRREKLIRNLIPGDPIVLAVPSYNGDLLAVSHKGRWARFAEKSVAGSGSLAMELPKGDSLIGILALSHDLDLILISEDGRLFVRPSADLKARRVGLQGGMLLKGQSLRGVAAGEELTVLTRRGKEIVVRAAELPFKAQTEAGTPLPCLATDDSVLAFTAR